MAPMEEDEERQNLGLLCFYPARCMESQVFAALADAGFTDLSIAQGRIAARIGPAGTRVTDLAEQAGVTKQTAGYLVDQLERAGYVRRVPDPTDARARLVQIADRGLAVREIARATEAVVEAEWAAHLGPRVTEQLRRALTRLREITDRYAEDHTTQSRR